jgi:hypothetical protein
MINVVPPRLTALSINELKLVHDIAVILDHSKFTNQTVAREAVALNEERQSRLWRASVLKIQSAIGT